MMMIFYAILFIFGLIFGSFLNVVSLRYRPGKAVLDLKILSGRSHCPHCKKKLTLWELFPLISFFAQGGKCLGCRGKISWQYPLIEFGSGLIFPATVFFLQKFYSFSFLAFTDFNKVFFVYIGFAIIWILIFLILLLLSVIDIKHFLIPDSLNISLLVLGVFVVLLKIFAADFTLPFRDSFLKNYQLIFSPFSAVWLNHLLGFLAGGLFFALLFYFGKGKAMGFGDVKLAATLGAILSFPDTALMIMLSFIFGGAWGVVLLFKKKKTLKDRLPFGPFIALATLVTVFWGYPILAGYFKLFNLYL